MVYMSNRLGLYAKFEGLSTYRTQYVISGYGPTRALGVVSAYHMKNPGAQLIELQNPARSSIIQLAASESI